LRCEEKRQNLQTQSRPPLACVKKLGGGHYRKKQPEKAHVQSDIKGLHHIINKTKPPPVDSHEKGRRQLRKS